MMSLLLNSYQHVKENGILFLLLVLFISSVASENSSRVEGRNEGEINSFDKNYKITWGKYHVRTYDKRRIVQLLLDPSSGSGFASKNKYLFGNFTLKMKLIHGDSSGLVTAFYLTTGADSNHDELDFEFLGAGSGKQYCLQTNVFADGEGAREERVHLWFDPTADFHAYSILWDPNQIIFMVDAIPIRVFKNLERKLGVPYPSKKPMQVVASLWNGEDWATDGGQRKINWKGSPFHVSFEGFEIQGCMEQHEEATNSSHITCSDSAYNAHNSDHHPLAWTYSPSRRTRLIQARSLQHVRRRYITYSYCRDKTRFESIPPECSENGF